MTISYPLSRACLQRPSPTHLHTRACFQRIVRKILVQKSFVERMFDLATHSSESGFICTAGVATEQWTNQRWDETIKAKFGFQELVVVYLSIPEKGERGVVFVGEIFGKMKVGEIVWCGRLQLSSLWTRQVDSLCTRGWREDSVLVGY